MRVGVIARATDRGLGIQTWEAARALDASVLVVDIRNHSSREHPTQLDRFPDAPVVECRPGWQLPEHDARAWLDTVDVVYSAETFYDERFCDWARDAGVATVVHANPEFTPPGGHGWGIGQPTAWWSATGWRLEHMPAGTRVVPFPVAADRFAPAEHHEDLCRWLHVAGKAAVGDRNGTLAVFDALRHLRHPCTIRVVTQERARWFADLPTPPDHVRVDVVTGGVQDYWQLYDRADALVMPRRYGGLCLPVQEAMAAGLAVVMTDVAPNPQTWPIVPVATTGAGNVDTPAGSIPVAEIDPAEVAATMDRLADPHERFRLQWASADWASTNSWDALRPVWLAAFAKLCAVPV